jgi:hypothetical protein
MALGLDDVRLIVGVLGGALCLLSICGMLVTAQNSYWFAKFVSAQVHI